MIADRCAVATLVAEAAVSLDFDISWNQVFFISAVCLCGRGDSSFLGEEHSARWFRVWIIFLVTICASVSVWLAWLRSALDALGWCSVWVCNILGHVENDWEQFLTCSWSFWVLFALPKFVRSENPNPTPCSQNFGIKSLVPKYFWKTCDYSLKVWQVPPPPSSIRARYLVHTWHFFFIFCQKFGSDCVTALYQWFTESNWVDVFLLLF